MPEGKGTYGRRLGRPKKKRPMGGATKRPMRGTGRAAKRGVATGAGRAARGVAGAAIGIAGKAIKRKPIPKVAKRAGKATVGSMMKKRRKARTTKRSSYL